MTVNKLILNDFTVFGAAAFEFSPGLNVLIGANGTGKTHVLKVLYGVLRPMATTWPNGAADNNACENLCERLGRPILDKLQMTFRPEPGRSPLTSLIRHGAKAARIDVQGDFGTVEITLNDNTAETNFPHATPLKAPAVFVPVNETLSMYPGFVAAYERRELSFDETYRDLCVDLSASALKTVVPARLAAIAETLESSVGGKTQLRGDKFFVSMNGGWLLEASLLAEGHRKLGSIAHLIHNGSLVEKGVLFWDEPEASLNPKLIPTVADALLALAGAGIQVFVATHDYLLTNEISVAAERGTAVGRQAAPRFFALSKPGPSEAAVAESGEVLAELRHNPILEEFAAHYDRQQELFRQPDQSSNQWENSAGADRGEHRPSGRAAVTMG